jgi:1,4-alpha-glucan branching enzyme
MGNEFGHPEWLDFPRMGNNWSMHYARRQYNLLDDKQLRYRYLAEFDRDMLCLDERFGLLTSAQAWISTKHEDDKIVAFERAGLLFVINFHPHQSYSDYRVGVDTPGKYKLCLNSDGKSHGGHDRVSVEGEYFTRDEGWNGRSHSLQVCPSSLNPFM